MVAMQVAGKFNSSDGDVIGNHGDSYYWIAKINSLGVIEWKKTLGGSGGDAFFTIQQVKDGTFVSRGYTHSKINGGFSPTGVKTDSDFWVVKLGFNTPTQDLNQSTKIKLSPNPTNNILSIEFTESTADEILITDVQGKVVFRELLLASIQKKDIDVFGFNNGI